MTTATAERQVLSESAEQLGWQRNEHERVDVYLRGNYRIHVMWRGTDTINGGSYYEDGALLTYSRESAKILSWLAK